MLVHSTLGGRNVITPILQRGSLRPPGAGKHPDQGHREVRPEAGLDASLVWLQSHCYCPTPELLPSIKIS